MLDKVAINHRLQVSLGNGEIFCIRLPSIRVLIRGVGRNQYIIFVSGLMTSKLFGMTDGQTFIVRQRGIYERKSANYVGPPWTDCPCEQVQYYFLQRLQKKQTLYPYCRQQTLTGKQYVEYRDVKIYACETQWCKWPACCSVYHRLSWREKSTNRTHNFE